MHHLISPDQRRLQWRMATTHRGYAGTSARCQHLRSFTDWQHAACARWWESTDAWRCSRCPAGHQSPRLMSFQLDSML